MGCLLLVPTPSLADHKVITLTLPSQLDNGHRYYHELLKTSLDAKGVKLNILTPAEHIPQKRVIKMVEKGQLSLTWMISTPERDNKYDHVNVPLTNGLIGKRVLLIPPSLQNKFDGISSLEALQKSGLVAGLGVTWFDVDVWRTNALEFYGVDGEWRAIYQMLTESGEVNYFPRGMTEIVQERNLNPHLAIEKNLLLVYEKDFKFYLSKDASKHKMLIEEALEQARQSGLMDTLIKKYWQESFEAIQPERRRFIRLQLPDNRH